MSARAALEAYMSHESDEAAAEFAARVAAVRAEAVIEAADALVTGFDWPPADRPTVEAVRNALRLMARGALPAPPVPDNTTAVAESVEQAAVRRSVDAQFPVVAAFLAEGDEGELARLREQRRFLLEQLAKKGARSGEADKALREFLNPDAEPGSHEPAIGDDPKAGESR